MTSKQLVYHFIWDTELAAIGVDCKNITYGSLLTGECTPWYEIIVEDKNRLWPTVRVKAINRIRPYAWLYSQQPWVIDEHKA